MMTITRSLAAVSAVLLMTATGLRAQDGFDTLYVNYDAGVSLQQTADFIESGFPAENAKFNPGVRADIAFGYNINKSFAVELEPGFMWNPVDTLNGHKLSD